MVVSPERPNCAAALNQPDGWYRRSVPSNTDLHPCAKRKPTHKPWCRRSVPSVQLPQTNPTDGIAVASQPGSSNLHGTTVSHNQHRYRQSVHALSRIAPTVSNLPAITSRTHRKRSDQAEALLTNHTTPSPAWCRRSASRDWPTHVRMTLPDPKTKVSPECPEIDRGRLSPSWSVRRLAAPRRAGPVKALGSL